MPPEDDVALDGWYHTIDLGEGRTSAGYYDHRAVVDRYGIPTSLVGRSALDVGTGDGFFAFEMERRGAERVVATDIRDVSEVDFLPGLAPAELWHDTPAHFATASRMLGSSVEWRHSNVYDLSPEDVGTFDVVLCGSLLLHLQNPWRALVNLRSVTRGMLIVETFVDTRLEEQHPDEPLVRIGHREYEERLGEACIYWRFSGRGLQEMLEYVGFDRVVIGPPFALPPHELPVRAVVGFVGSELIGEVDPWGRPWDSGPAGEGSARPGAGFRRRGRRRSR